jgi:hypothetical protein
MYSGGLRKGHHGHELLTLRALAHTSTNQPPHLQETFNLDRNLGDLASHSIFLASISELRSNAFFERHIRQSRIGPECQCHWFFTYLSGKV